MSENTYRTHSTLKGYIEDFQKNGEEILYELIRHKTVVEDGKQVTRLSFADRFLDKLLSDVKFQHFSIPRSHIEAYFLSCLYGDQGAERGLLYQVNCEKYSASEVCSFVAKRIKGHIKNCLKKEYLYYVDQDDPDATIVIQEGKLILDEDGGESTHLDDYSYDQFIQVEDYSNAYEDFLEHVGHMEKILSEKQYSVYYWLKNGLTQEQTGEKLGTSQQDIQQTQTALEKRIRTAYTEYKTYEILASGKGKAYKVLMDFQESYQKIIQFAGDDFDYFNFTASWILDNKSKIDDVNFEELQKNKMTGGLTVIDLISDGVKGRNSELLELVMAGEAHEVTTQQDKDRFVMSILRSIKAHEKAVSKAVSGISKLIVDAGEEKYDYFGENLGNN